MDFRVGEDERLLADGVARFLERECTPDDVRAARQSGPDRDRWRGLADLGLTGLLIPESDGGLGLGMVALVACIEESGRAALPEPLADVAGVAAPLLAELDGDLADRWLEPTIAGAAIVLLAPPGGRLLPAGANADLVLVPDGGDLHVLDRSAGVLERRDGIDPTRPPMAVTAAPEPSTLVTSDGAGLLAAASDRGAVGAAAELLGVAARMLELATEHAKTREQFGRPIGSFQAVKHRLADSALSIEFARPVVYRAAWSIDADDADRGRDASMAKLYATSAATGTAKAALQVHGAIGYTEEHDLHLWMGRAWALADHWGGEDTHLARVAESVID